VYTVGKERKGKWGFKLTLPSSKYIGPGNPLVDGDPTSTADTVAFGHDWKYHVSEFEDEISQSDKAAIQEFWLQFKRQKTLSPLIGSLGIAAKYALDRLLGFIIYPKVWLRHAGRLGYYLPSLGQSKIGSTKIKDRSYILYKNINVCALDGRCIYFLCRDRFVRNFLLRLILQL
jgi:hypothetical protein